MTKFVSTACALMLATVSAPAFAQANPTFTGPRVEAILGFDKVVLPGLGNPNGLLYGAGVGFDFAAGGFLIGAEGEIADSTGKLKLVGPDLKTGRDLYVGGRVGTIIGGENLLYVKGGYTNARFSVRNLDSGNLDGFRVGAGIEHALGGNSFVKIEYRYSNYENDVARHQGVGSFGVRF